MAVTPRPLFDPPDCSRAVGDAFRKLEPAHMLRNPVMFVVLVGSVFTTFALCAIVTGAGRHLGFDLADRALAVVHGAVRQLRRGHGRRARQGAGRHAAQDQDRRRWPSGSCRRDRTTWSRCPPRCARATSSSVAPGDVIPGDGEVIEGVASVDESAITGESAPVIRESGGDRSAVTGGTQVLSDRIIDPDHAPILARRSSIA